ncbi:4-(cytidine 5'-diphospho)-2-C-methyl-D-erythritol kinase [Vulgatibacter incomptus]|uniref:4-diphosphocytidyl-2-C-methyl-D-erythritol kinase n=1 Tax=Vulgatibacter incomptus TaxID=1391653 RepID=A0A0K1PEF9_9BACT|nr:4-(cytidine 5'-diphospho)-2-C-methyl-D-erythritol kinase [Vulgatibacter incomptus]AKU91923.1 4-diphosphocytidyl-2-C-methyl-D-erythritol kinase [Vulgatibacter incomptus]
MHVYDAVAPAKVNLTLHVLSKRPDGYHDLASLMVPISLADRLRIEVGEGSAVRVEVPGRPELEGDSNLCAAAARAFARELGSAGSVRVVLDKRVPIAAGLGGGSSDAAAVLRALARHRGVALDDPRLHAAALSVGSDVPFFLRCEAALVGGRGELLLPAPGLPELLAFVIVQAPYGVSAREAYEGLAAMRASGELPPGHDEPLPAALGSAEEVAGILTNDLEAAVSRTRPIGDCKTRLLEAGVLAALMSGSGPSVLGVARDAAHAEACARSLRRAPGEEVHVARTLKAFSD